jgi:hypothetical protein
MCRSLSDRIEFTFLRLVADNSVLFGVYLLVLLFALNQKAIYLGLMQQTGLWPFSREKLKGVT